MESQFRPNAMLGFADGGEGADQEAGPNRAERRRLERVLKARKRRGQRAYERHLKVAAAIEGLES